MSMIRKTTTTCALKCNGCGKVSKFQDTEQEAIAHAKLQGWTKQMEVKRDRLGRARRGAGLVVNNYCGKCTRKRVAAFQGGNRARARPTRGTP